MVTYNRGPEQVVKVSKDPIPILEELGIRYPAIKVACEAAKMQREEAGDGVTMFVLLLTGLLRRADELMAIGVHPNTILKGYREAARRAVQLLGEFSVNGSGAACLDGIDCGRGFLTPSIRGMMFDALEAASEGGRYDRDKVRIEKSPGGRASESRLVRGIIVKREKAHPGMPDRVESPRIAILSGKLGVNRMEVKMRTEGPPEINLNIKDPSQMASYRAAEHNLRFSAVECIAAAGASVLLCQQLVNDDLKTELARRGIFTLEKVDQKDSEAVARATGARIVGEVRSISPTDIGGADLLEVDRIDPEKVAVISGCRGATFILRGTTHQALDELESVIRGGVTVLSVADRDPRLVLGGGATEVKLAGELRRYALRFSGREQVAIEAYADALEEVTKLLAENSGLDPNLTIADLRKCQENGVIGYGVGRQGCAKDVPLDLTAVKVQAITRAYDVAELMLRIDEFLISREMTSFHKQ